MRIKFKFFIIIFHCLLICFLIACSSAPKFNFKYENDPALRAFLEKEVPVYPETSFLVVSDLHVYDLNLGTEGKAFEDYLNNDRKLLREGTELFNTFFSEIKNEKADFVLVTGDLTKDGERVSHDLAAGYLRNIEATGKKVYVVPGNHDIKNGISVKYSGNITERVPNIAPEEFAQIYNEFGFQEALYRDSNSLSYVVDLQPGLWLLALDACLYQQNIEGEKSITDGKLNNDTLKWVEAMLEKAAREKKAVIAMIHHGIMEHYETQEKNYGQYIIDDFPAISKFLAIYNVRLVFTGHYHAQDITISRVPDTKKFVFDIETGSIITFPCPYRIVNINATQKAQIQSQNIKSIPSHPTAFPEFARKNLQDNIKSVAIDTILKYQVNRAEADKIAEQVAEAVIANFAGDEYLPPGQEAIKSQGLSIPGWLVVTVKKDFINGLWKDLEPADNNVTLDLVTGNWQ